MRNLIPTNEAHRYWCPFARVPLPMQDAQGERLVDGEIPANRMNDEPLRFPTAAGCLGVRCMAYVVHRPGQEGVHMTNPAGSGAWIADQHQADALVRGFVTTDPQPERPSSLGYCGLAGGALRG